MQYRFLNYYFYLKLASYKQPQPFGQIDVSRSLPLSANVGCCLTKSRSG